VINKNSDVARILEYKILPYVSKPGRYIGTELNTVHKDAQSVTLRVALAFPEVYEIAMSYIGFDILYHVLNKQADIWAERVYTPWPDMEERMRQHHLPLFSLESFTPLKEFHIIGFTFQYELTYTNVLNMLDLAGIPLWAEQRPEDAPFIIAGGPCTCNPEPMAQFIDAFLIGDGEEAALEMAQVVGQGRLAGKTRREILKELAGIRGVYVPAFYRAEYDAAGRFTALRVTEQGAPQRVLSRILPELKAQNYPDKPIVPLLGITHDRISIEVMRGCTEGCRYCNAGMIYRPTRERPVQEVLNQMQQGLENTGYREASFLSLSISDYAPLNDLMRGARELLQGSTINVSFPSMRLDSFSDEIARFVSEVRKSGFTFAPEAGSERLRRVINKNITEEDLYRSVRIALENGWKLLKFYFMIGLPTETEEDVLAIADLVESVVKISRPYGKVRFNISISPFSPKAHTPFQWERQDTREELLYKTNLLKRRFSRFPWIKLSWRDPDVSLVENVLGRADRRMSRVIYQAWLDGAKFDGWDEYFRMERWLQAAGKCRLPFTEFAAEIDPQAALPWEHIDKGVSKKFLLKERDNAYQEITNIDCKSGTCYACGIQRKHGFAEYAECYKPAERRKTPPDLSKTQSAPPQLKMPAVTAHEEFSRLRVQYQKTGYARFLSHLDLVRIFERACRRAQIPLRYSQGFNPHPKVSFGPPLALGYSSEAEYMDMEIAVSFTPEIVNYLNPFLPHGLRLLKAKPIVQKVTALAAAINSSEYWIDLQPLSLSQQEFEQALEKLLSARHIEVQRKVKGKLKAVNIRPYIDSIEREQGMLRIKTRTIESRTVRIAEIMTQLLHGSETDGRELPVHRYRQSIRTDNREISPLDILP